MENESAYNIQAMTAGLAKSFDESEIKSRPGSGGKDYRYVQPSAIIRRLNDAVGHWNFEVRKEWTENGVTKALVRLEVVGLGYREHIGIQEQGGNQGADALAKGAVSDGLKKAASLFGIALDLYEDAPSQQQYPQQYQQPQGAQVPQYQQQQQQRPPQQQQAPMNMNQQQRPPQQQQQQRPPQQQNQQYSQQDGPKPYDPGRETGEYPSEAQGRKLHVVLTQTGIPVEQAAQPAGVYNFSGIDNLTKRQMSAIIDWLTYQPGGENHSGGGGQESGGNYGGSNYGGSNYGGVDDPYSDMNDVPF